MKINFLLPLITLTFIGCGSEERLNPKSVTSIETVGVKTEIDNYITENFQKPYNIKVVYRWKDSDNEFNKFLYPPTLNKVVPLLEIIKKIWIEPYQEVGGDDFIKAVAPRQISLVGSSNYTSTGVKNLGFADNGSRITLFEVDAFDFEKAKSAEAIFRIIQHEYCHIINYKKNFSDDYKLITPEGYTSSWHLIKDNTAREDGFISAYAKADEYEDFAEMTMTILTNSKTQYDAIIESVRSTTAKEKLRKKEEFVANYFKTEWNIDIYRLQEIISVKTAELLK